MGLEPTYQWLNSALLTGRLDPGFNSPEAVRIRAVIARNTRHRAFGDLCETISCGPFGSTLVAGEHSANGNIVLVQPTDIADDLFTFTPGWKISIETLSQKRLSLLSPGTLLFARKGIYPHCAVLPARVGPSTLGSSMVATRLSAQADPYFFAAFFRSEFGQALMSASQTTTAQPTLGTEDISELLVPFPTDTVQASVGNKLRKAERLRELAEQEDAQIGSALRGALGTPEVANQNALSYWVSRELLSEYRINPTEYHPYALCAETRLRVNHNGCRLKDALISPDDLSGGATPLGGSYSTAGVGFLRVQNIAANRLDLADLVYIDKDTDIELSRSRIRSEDVVITITGYPGTACCIKESDLPLNVNQHVVRFHLRDEWNPYFVAAFLNSPWGKAQITRRSIGGTRDALDYPSIESMVLPLLPRSAQDEVGDHARRFADLWTRSRAYAMSAKQDVVDLIEGTLDESKLLAEGEKIVGWLKRNPSPYGEPSGDDGREN